MQTSAGAKLEVLILFLVLSIKKFFYIETNLCMSRLRSMAKHDRPARVPHINQAEMTKLEKYSSAFEEE